jgi:RNA polymerase sigma-70 factor (ECF subfamily)
MQRSAQQCKDALAVYKEAESVIRSILYGYVRNPRDVEELAQEVFIRILIQPDPSIVGKPLCITIAHNIARDDRRARSYRNIVYVPDVGEEQFELEHQHRDDDLHSLMEAEEEMGILLKAVERLPHSCRSIFILRKVYGLTQKEIAEHVKISENTVEQHLTKAARMLADALFGNPNVSVLKFGVASRRK